MNESPAPSDGTDGGGAAAVVVVDEAADVTSTLDMSTEDDVEDEDDARMLLTPPLPVPPFEGVNEATDDVEAMAEAMAAPSSSYLHALTRLDASKLLMSIDDIEDVDEPTDDEEVVEDEEEEDDADSELLDVDERLELDEAMLAAAANAAADDIADDEICAGTGPLAAVLLSGSEQIALRSLSMPSKMRISRSILLFSSSFLTQLKS